MKDQISAKWCYSSDDAAKELGNSPLDLLNGAEIVKSNAVRKVFRNGEYFIKFDRRISFGFRSEFQAAGLCCRYNIPAVEHLAWGQTPEGSFLITRAASGFVESTQFFSRKQEWRYYEALADFLYVILQKKIFHPDLHPGNILLNPDTCEMKLVDLHGIREWNFFDNFRFYLMQRNIMEVRDHLCDEKMTELIGKCGIRNEKYFFTKALLREFRLLRHNFPKRRRQILNGYPKYTCLEHDGTLTASGISAEELAAAEEIRLPEAEKLFVFNFFLSLAHIPHRRVLAFDRANSVVKIERELPEEYRSDASAGELQNRLLFNGIRSRSEDFRDGFLHDITAVCLLNS